MSRSFKIQKFLTLPSDLNDFSSSPTISLFGPMSLEFQPKFLELGQFAKPSILMRKMSQPCIVISEAYVKPFNPLSACVVVSSLTL